jgi:hypothetical protein
MQQIRFRISSYVFLKNHQTYVLTAGVLKLQLKYCYIILQANHALIFSTTNVLYVLLARHVQMIMDISFRRDGEGIHRGRGHRPPTPHA